MGVVNWGLNWGGGEVALKWGGGGNRIKKTYNNHPWNSCMGSYENLIQTPENLVFLGFRLKKQ